MNWILFLYIFYAMNQTVSKGLLKVINIILTGAGCTTAKVEVKNVFHKINNYITYNKLKQR